MKFDIKSLKYLFQNSLRVTVGVILVGLGIVGLLLPLLQGILLIGLGLAMLGIKVVQEKMIMLKNKLQDWLGLSK